MSEFTQSVMFAAPPTMLPDLKVAVEESVPRLSGAFSLELRLGRAGTTYANAAFLFGALTLKEAEVALLRPMLSPQGALYELGCRARRNLFGAREVKAPAVVEGKITVDVIEAGAEIPAGVEWDTTRVSKERFFEELGVTMGGDGSPVEQLEAPEPAI